MSVRLAQGGRRAQKRECPWGLREQERLVSWVRTELGDADLHRPDLVIDSDLGGVPLPEASQLASVTRSGITRRSAARSA